MSSPVSTRTPCPDCGHAPSFHRFLYLSACLAGRIPNPLATRHPLLRGAARFAHGIERVLTPRILGLLMDAGTARRGMKPDEATQLLARMLWNEAEARGIRVSEFRPFGLPCNVFVARYPDGRSVAYEGIPLPGCSDLERTPWMSDKAMLTERFRALGFPAARGGSARTLAEARRVFAGLVPPVIVKPSSGSGSRHTTLHILDEEWLARGFALAKQVAPTAVIEEELSGAVYRVTVVDGAFAAALRRDQPHVIGDGARTVEELVRSANEHPARQGPYFHRMKLDEAALEELRWQDLDAASVPAAGRRVTLHQKISWNVGGTTADVTDDIHPDTVALLEEAARMLRAPVAGFDVVIGDPARSWKEQDRCGILECNSMPFFDNHHLPFEGRPRNVAARIWDMNP